MSRLFPKHSLRMVATTRAGRARTEPPRTAPKTVQDRIAATLAKNRAAPRDGVTADGRIKGKAQTPAQRAATVEILRRGPKKQLDETHRPVGYKPVPCTSNGVENVRVPQYKQHRAVWSGSKWEVKTVPIAGHCRNRDKDETRR